MRDQDVTTTTTPEQMTFADEAGTPPAEPTPEELQAAQLSRAAREAVRQPADPRIDRQLARMGLADDEDPTLSGGRTPVTGFHSTIERPDSVSRVAPPTTTVKTISAATTSSHTRMARRMVGDDGCALLMHPSLAGTARKI